MGPELSRRTFLQFASSALTGLGLAPAAALNSLTAPGASRAGLEILKTAVPLLGQLGKLRATGEAAQAAYFLMQYPTGIGASNSALTLNAARIVGDLVFNDRFGIAAGQDAALVADALLPSRREELKPENLGMSHFTHLPRIGPMARGLDLEAHDEDALREYLGRVDPALRVKFSEREAWGELVQNGLNLREAMRRSPELRDFADARAKAGDTDIFWRSTDALINTLRNSVGSGSYFVGRMGEIFGARERSKFPAAEAWRYVEVFSDPERVIPKLMTDPVFKWQSRFMQGYHRVFDELGRVRRLSESIEPETADVLREASARLKDLKVEVPERWSSAVERHCPAPVRETVPERVVEQPVAEPAAIRAELGDLSALILPAKARRTAEGVEIIRKLKDTHTVRARLKLGADRWSLSVRSSLK